MTAAISHHIAGGGMVGRQVPDGRLVGHLSRRQRDHRRQDAVIDHGIDLRAQSATRAAGGTTFASLFARGLMLAGLNGRTVDELHAVLRVFDKRFEGMHPNPALARQLKRLPIVVRGPSRSD